MDTALVSSLPLPNTESLSSDPHMVLIEQGLSAALNTRIIGSANEVMVLAHGFGGDQSIWKKIIPFLAQYFKLILFDWPFSSSAKDPNLYDPVKHSSCEAFASDLITLLDENNVKSSIFVGHSISGMIGCAASVRRPELFKRLILIGASPRYINTDGYEGGFNDSEIDQIISTMEASYDEWAEGFASRVVDSKDPLSVETFEKSLKRMRPEVAVPMGKTVFHLDERELLDKVMTPCTIIQTTDDIVVPNSVAYYMQEKIKAKSTVEIIDTIGHFPQLTAHEQLLDVMGGVLGFDYVVKN